MSATTTTTTAAEDILPDPSVPIGTPPSSDCYALAAAASSSSSSGGAAPPSPTPTPPPAPLSPSPSLSPSPTATPGQPPAEHHPHAHVLRSKTATRIGAARLGLWERRILKVVKHTLKKRSESVLSASEHSELVQDLVSAISSMISNPELINSTKSTEAHSMTSSNPAPSPVRLSARARHSISTSSLLSLAPHTQAPSPPKLEELYRGNVSRIVCEMLVKFLSYLTESLFPSHMFFALCSLLTCTHHREVIGILRVMLSAIAPCNLQLLKEFSLLLASLPIENTIAYSLWSSFESVLIWAPENRVANAETKRIRNFKLDEWLCSTLVNDISLIQAVKPLKMHCKPEQGILKGTLLCECIGVGSTSIPKLGFCARH
ncbi:hypothetical protein Pelo_17025 [Pelomyxa schiedti]|nr:hypothetical protein Pelo_17025 [Pelomyxa schiedti]